MNESMSRVLSTIALALGLVGASVVASRAAVSFIRIKNQDRTISSTGSARRRIRSDLVVWRAAVSARATTRAEAYATLVRDVPRARQWLIAKGFPAEVVQVQAVTTHEIHPRAPNGQELEETIVAYELSQDIRIETRDVDRVAAAERDITQLMSDGLAIESFAPRYLYTRLGELKIELTAEAARDAYTRADQIARQSHVRLGQLSRGRMGVFQVNAANETETSSEGVNDTESLEKDALAVVGSVFYSE
jgi:uncharacterized protein